MVSAPLDPAKAVQIRSLRICVPEKFVEFLWELSSTQPQLIKKATLIGWPSLLVGRGELNSVPKCMYWLILYIAHVAWYY